LLVRNFPGLDDVVLRKKQLSEMAMRYVILWLAGVPIVGIILLKVLGFI